MASNPLLRFRRSAAQLHALAEVERTIRATDTKCRRKYLRDFNEAFRTYRRVLPLAELQHYLTETDVVLMGDYHALPASQRFTAELVELLSASGKSVVLGVEAIVARDQHILDEWQRREIDSGELRSRIRFESDWGYDWQPFRELLERARVAGVKIYGLDCSPRQDMRSIRARDRHAAVKIAELRAAHPDAVTVVLFGESHLAPNHLPMLIRELCPEDELLTVLQNVDALYWLSAGEPQDLVEAVEVRDNVLCVFSATPLEKYEHYRLCIERWKKMHAGTLDLAPSFYNLIASLFRFLNVNPYATRSRFSQALLVDELPELWCVNNEEQLERLLARRMSTPGVDVRRLVKQQGSCFVPDRNVIVAHEFRMPWAAEQAARFVHYVCRGGKPCPAFVEDEFYANVVSAALGFLGAKILCPSRKLYDPAQLRAEYQRAEHEIERLGISRGNYHHLLAWVENHKNPERRNTRRHLLPVTDKFKARERELAASFMGHLLGSELYTAYVSGDLSKRRLRNLFFRDLTKPGSARALYFRAAELAGRRGHRAGHG
jgi:hypothetical protein